MQVERADFVGVPSRNAAELRDFYAETFGLRRDPNAEYELWAGDLCLAFWEPERIGREFQPQKNAHIALRVPDVGAARAELEAKGVRFNGETVDTGVCHIALFEDPEGNDLMLHRRYAPFDDERTP